MTQTGGQCRATNYIAILKKAMIAAGYKDIPVVSLAFGGDILNEQPGFNLKWSKVIHVALAAILFGDCISQMYHATVVREKIKGKSATLRDFYIAKCAECIARKDIKGMYALVEEAADHFNELANQRTDIPKIGVVGEIYLKHNGFSNRYLYQWLADQGVEVVAPTVLNFFLQSFVNSKVNRKQRIERVSLPSFVIDIVYQLAMRYVRKFNAAGSKFRYFTPFADIFEEAKHAEEVVNLAAQYGEGWLIPAELANFAHMGVNNAISLQPFGCIANHVVAKGIAKKVNQLYPEMNMLFLDFDGGTSEVNVLNRIHFMVDNAKATLVQKTLSTSAVKEVIKP
jgi:predicted nucleotide-binding protein (sugar kinase/HSP70/actin superfamily)